MPSPCTVCLHPNRPEVDQRLARERVNVAALARSLGVGRKALERHRERHVPVSLAKLHAHVAAEPGSSLLAELECLFLLTLNALAAAEGAALSHVDPNHLGAVASHAAIAASVNEARRHLGDLAELFVAAAEAGDLAEPDDPVVTTRVVRALDGVAARASALASTA